MNNGRFSNDELASMNPQEFRNIVRRGGFTDTTAFVCSGYAQANLVIIPGDMAFDFLLFCQRNPRPCFVLDVSEPGDPHPKQMAPSADLRTDVPKYRIYKDGKIVDEPTSIVDYWRDDLVAFLIACSFTFDQALRFANVKYRIAGAYTTNIECMPAGRFHSYMIVSCRIAKDSYQAVRMSQISSRYPTAHGAPIHIGDPAEIGIRDLYHPDSWFPAFLDRSVPPLKPGEIPMFWGCGITPQTAAIESKVPYMITHWPGHMFVTDKRAGELAML